MPKKRKVSKIYDYFQILDEYPLEAVCKACNDKVPRGGKTLAQCGTTNLVRHLKRHHPDLWTLYEARAEETKLLSIVVKEEEKNLTPSDSSSTDPMFHEAISGSDAIATAQVLPGAPIDNQCPLDGLNDTGLSPEQYRTLKRRQLELDVEIKELTAKHLRLQIMKLQMELNRFKSNQSGPSRSSK